MTMKNISGNKSRIQNNIGSFDEWKKQDTTRLSSWKTVQLDDPMKDISLIEHKSLDAGSMKKTDSAEHEVDTATIPSYFGTLLFTDKGNAQTKAANTENAASQSTKIQSSKLSQANQSSQSLIGLIGGGNSRSSQAESQAASTESVASPPKKLQQASMSRLSQANQTPQRVLGLIGGETASAQAETKAASTEEVNPEAIDPQPVERGGSVDIAG